MIKRIWAVSGNESGRSTLISSIKSGDLVWKLIDVKYELVFSPGNLGTIVGDRDSSIFVVSRKRTLISIETHFALSVLSKWREVG